MVAWLGLNRNGGSHQCSEARLVAVVCGAWHVPALRQRRKPSEDRALLKGLPRLKVAATWEGIRAAEILQAQAIDCNVTLLFCMAQAMACADAGAFLISPFVGRILDWHVKAGGGPYDGENDPGVATPARSRRWPAATA